MLLNKSEANLPRKSVVNVSQRFTVDKSDLAERIGALSEHRVQQVLAGVTLLLQPRESPLGP